MALRRDLPVVRIGAAAEDSQGAFFSRRPDWTRLGLKADVMAALTTLGITRPSHVQVCVESACVFVGGVRVCMCACLLVCVCMCLCVCLCVSDRLCLCQYVQCLSAYAVPLIT